jgi:hypothetical protein
MPSASQTCRPDVPSGQAQFTDNPTEQLWSSCGSVGPTLEQAAVASATAVSEAPRSLMEAVAVIVA